MLGTQSGEGSSAAPAVVSCWSVDQNRQHLRLFQRTRMFLNISCRLILIRLDCSVYWTTPNLWAAAAGFDDEQWKAQFRVSRATFDHLLQLIGPAIKRRKTNYRVPIEPRRRLAITMWWLARSGEYRSIADMFGVGIATVCTIVRQVSSAIVERLFHRFVSLPSGPRLDAALQAFKDRCYPQCAGVIGGTHIPIAPPRNNPDHYINRSGWHSVILQAVVDHDVCFTDVYAGWPGSSSSATVLSSSDLYLKRSLLSDGVEIPVHLIGDASFPLKPWLMKGYVEEQQLSPEQRRFSYTLSSARSAVDVAFARLKGRWRCLLKKSDIDISMVPRVVAACCVLHNICELRGDSFLPEWNVDMAPSDNYLTQPDVEPYAGDTYCTAEKSKIVQSFSLETHFFQTWK
uniref:DDE Tnp4 domain-containing protein n=1 Tax=Scophthalmus maximus TaxID=52904 RepID=A0A8D3D085_SCOMX